jgi:clan AA aspartic protease
MIMGFIDELGQPKVRLTVLGLRGQVDIEPVIDTGFDGGLCLPIPIAIRLGLELHGCQTVELADGSRRRELVFVGTVLFDGENRPVEISVTEAEDALVGTGLLATHKLDIGFLSKTVRLTDERQGRTQP